MNTVPKVYYNRILFLWDEAFVELAVISAFETCLFIINLFFYKKKVTLKSFLFISCLPRCRFVIHCTFHYIFYI